mmetsp:Transcript_95133/g.295859  ORF Transcript_95133/g.295859 Transcript_95133/m.295859 type:complete len:230 (+) Transcript_95133:629-1318(+)
MAPLVPSASSRGPREPLPPVRSNAHPRACADFARMMRRLRVMARTASTAPTAKTAKRISTKATGAPPPSLLPVPFSSAPMGIVETLGTSAVGDPVVDGEHAAPRQSPQNESVMLPPAAKAASIHAKRGGTRIPCRQVRFRVGAYPAVQTARHWAPGATCQPSAHGGSAACGTPSGALHHGDRHSNSAGYSTPWEQASTASDATKPSSQTGVQSPPVHPCPPGRSSKQGG